MFLTGAIKAGTEAGLLIGIVLDAIRFLAVSTSRSMRIVFPPREI